MNAKQIREKEPMSGKFKLQVGPRVKEVHVVQVPCASSSTGMHYITLMVGEKTQLQGTYEWDFAVATMPHMLFASCTCVDTTPLEVLDGMLELRKLSTSNKSAMCYETLVVLREIVSLPASRSRRELLESLPLALSSVLGPLCVAKVARRVRIYTTESRDSRAARQFTAVFNKLAGVASGTFTVRYNKGFSLENQYGSTLARRLKGEWFIVEGWQEHAPWPFDTNTFESWAARLKGIGGLRQCSVCPPHTRLRRKNHAMTAVHQKRVITAVKQGLLATRGSLRFLGAEERQYFSKKQLRTPLDKYEGINVVTLAVFLDLFYI